MKIMVVTANQNETTAVLDCESFSHRKSQRSNDPQDSNFYNIGKWASYNVIHFQLPQQGSVGANASALSLATAINCFNPNAVILVGIAFGMDNRDDAKRTQNIGDVLISEKVADYESGKIQGETLLSDGAIPESGRQLVSIFKHYSPLWEHKIQDRKAACEFGLLLSGDKVVNDKKFKKVLKQRFQRAIGGEMEGRGAYAACRSRGVAEWIIVKGISDWADGTKSLNPREKEENQIIAARSAVSLLDFVLSDSQALSKLSKTSKKPKKSKSQSGKGNNIKLIGFFVNFGITSCRLFEVYNDKKTLKEIKIITYRISDPKDPGYLNNIITHVTQDVLPTIIANEHIFIKAFADSMFMEIFHSERDRNEFIMRFYTETSLYFNIVSEKQTEENLKRQFGNVGSNTAVVDIGSQCVDIVVKRNKKYKKYNIPISLKDITDYIGIHGIQEKWNEQNVVDIKEYVIKLIGKRMGDNSTLQEIKEIGVEDAIIIKNELTFMAENGYHLVFNNGGRCISFVDYQKDNYDLLFSIDYRKALEEKYRSDNSKINRYYGFKMGHILLEAIFEYIGIQSVVPKDELSIHGSIDAYIFNVVISGSTHEGRSKYMIEADKIMRDMGATVLSPRIVNGVLTEKTEESDIKHASAIRDCDLLFVCDKDGYIGEQTSHEIYGAFLLSKPIAFWKEPSETFNRLKFIPHEQWWNLMKTLEERM